MSRGTVQNRKSFLNNIAEKMGRARVDHVERPVYKHRPQWDVYANATPDELLDVFKEQCQHIHTDVIEVEKSGVAKAVAETFGRYQAQSYLMWDDPRLKDVGLDDRFQEQMKQLDVDTFIWDPDSDENIRVAEQATVGITYSDMTLAESGTVVLFSSSEKGRAVSLLPETYIAIIPKSSLVPRMTQATYEIHQRVENGERLPSCINFISGPSNSADIEMSLVVGVHGPVKATYIVFDDE
ncbi:lactate utilization protein C [Geomicrobium sp. JSM 1781026]|uniref:LutC/YkgG family protein n=1 Tax=Geomicrobium sp. JSM 1781026 TaxID=3344580 RepID=UPI0035C01EAA